VQKIVQVSVAHCEEHFRQFFHVFTYQKTMRLTLLLCVGMEAGFELCKSTGLFLFGWVNFLFQKAANEDPIGSVFLYANQSEEVFVQGTGSGL